MNKILALLLMTIAVIGCKSATRNTTDGAHEHKQADPNAKYKVLKKIKIPGDGGWDYAAFDTVHRRLFIAHSTKVDVLDVDKEQVAGEIPDTKGVHGIAFAYDLNKGFTSNGKDSSVTVFDLGSLKVLNKIKINASNPDAILYDPFSKRVFTFNGHSNDFTAIDAETGKVIGNTDLGGKPEFSVSDGFGKVFVNIEDKNEVKVINPKTLKIDFTWKLDSGQEPSGMAYDITYRRLFIACGNKILEILNAENGKKTLERNIGDGVDAAAFNPDTKIAFTSNGEGNLSVIHQIDLDHYTEAENIPTQKGARTLAIDIRADRIYLPVADFGPPAKAEPGKKQRPGIVPGSFGVLVVGK